MRKTEKGKLDDDRDVEYKQTAKEPTGVQRDAPERRTQSKQRKRMWYQALQNVCKGVWQDEEKVHCSPRRSRSSTVGEFQKVRSLRKGLRSMNEM